MNTAPTRHEPPPNPGPAQPRRAGPPAAGASRTGGARPGAPATAGPAAGAPGTAPPARSAPGATTRATPSGATPETAAPTRRERKKIETRAALEAAALRLFAKQGYERTTVEEIAEAADVAVRTFFRYFQSKQHVLYGDMAMNITDQMRAALLARPATESPVQAVGAALDAMELGDPDQQQQVLDRLRLMERMPELGGTYHMIFQHLHDVIAEHVADRTGLPPAELYPQLLAAAAIAAIKAALAVFEAAGGRQSLIELRARAYSSLTAGIGDPPRG
ncbi:acyl-CoA-like ligand-binding transcription factor [Rugosimonospora acidiphila]|uniref:acyl-CoA-like ligand-binding transcription factor n=1 Tax=Rugosimonospora acidiphila TaxID=556531 RepID=UPI0031E4F82A